MPSGPRIGVTRWDDVPGEARDRYWARILEAGGEVVDLDESAASRVAELAPTLDALMLTGGIDVDPASTARERHPEGEGNRRPTATTWSWRTLERALEARHPRAGHLPRPPAPQRRIRRRAAAAHRQRRAPRRLRDRGLPVALARVGLDRSRLPRRARPRRLADRDQLAPPPGGRQRTGSAPACAPSPSPTSTADELIEGMESEQHSLGRRRAVAPGAAGGAQAGVRAR